jgi:hypothetical protein
MPLRAVCGQACPCKGCKRVQVNLILHMNPWRSGTALRCSFPPSPDEEATSCPPVRCGAPHESEFFYVSSRQFRLSPFRPPYSLVPWFPAPLESNVTQTPVDLDHAVSLQAYPRKLRDLKLKTMKRTALNRMMQLKWGCRGPFRHIGGGFALPPRKCSLVSFGREAVTCGERQPPTVSS